MTLGQIRLQMRRWDEDTEGRPLFMQAH